MTALLLLLAAPAFAQKAKDDDAPIPYPEDEAEEERSRRELPRRSDPTNVLREESDYEKSEREEVLATLDDPNFGISGELVLGLMLLDSSRGGGVETRVAWGIRATWEWGRMFSEEWLRDALFADFTWSYAAYREGTQTLFADANYHYFTVAPAYALPFGPKSNFAAYAQAGLGLTYQYSAVHVDSVETNISGTKLAFQYGIGIRARPAIVDDESMRLSFRFEITRFRRSYMDDTFLGGSVGLTF